MLSMTKCNAVDNLKPSTKVNWKRKVNVLAWYEVKPKYIMKAYYKPIESRVRSPLNPAAPRSTQAQMATQQTSTHQPGDRPVRTLPS